MEILKEDRITCGDCHTILADIVITDTNQGRKEKGLKPLKMRTQIICYKCGGKSFLSPIYEGTISLGVINNDIVIESIDTNIKDGVIINTLETKKI